MYSLDCTPSFLVHTHAYFSSPSLLGFRACFVQFTDNDEAATLSNVVAVLRAFTFRCQAGVFAGPRLVCAVFRFETRAGLVSHHTYGAGFLLCLCSAVMRCDICGVVCCLCFCLRVAVLDICWYTSPSRWGNNNTKNPVRKYLY